MNKASKIALSIFAVLYIIICILSGFAATIFFNDDLTYNWSVDKDRARVWGLPVYEDVTIEPDVFNLPYGKMRLGNAFLTIGRYRHFTIPFVPGVITANKYSFKIDSDWQRIKLRFDVIESPTGSYEIKILEDPNNISPIIYNGTPYSIDVTKDRHEQYHCYIVDSRSKEKVGGTDFVITVSWDKALKDWGSKEKVWYPGYSDPCEVNK